jgi:hypothetical protein
MLFIKYIFDKYGDSDDFTPPVTIPPWASFKDMVALKGKSDQPQGKWSPNIGKGHGPQTIGQGLLPLSYMPCPENIYKNYLEPLTAGGRCLSETYRDEVRHESL